MPLTVKDAVAAASRYVQELYGDAAGDSLLEEVDTTKDGSSWLITLSFRRNEGGMIMFPQHRLYRVFTIGKETGEIHKMKMRAKVSMEDAERI